MEPYEYTYKGRVYIIHLQNVGNRFDWFFTDSEGNFHPSDGETASTDGVAIIEAKEKIHRLANKSS